MLYLVEHDAVKTKMDASCSRSQYLMMRPHADLQYILQLSCPTSLTQALCCIPYFLSLIVMVFLTSWLLHVIKRDDVHCCEMSCKMNRDYSALTFVLVWLFF